MVTSYSGSKISDSYLSLQKLYLRPDSNQPAWKELYNVKLDINYHRSASLFDGNLAYFTDPNDIWGQKKFLEDETGINLRFCSELERYNEVTRSCEPCEPRK